MGPGNEWMSSSRFRPHVRSSSACLTAFFRHPLKLTPLSTSNMFESSYSILCSSHLTPRWTRSITREQRCRRTSSIPRFKVLPSRHELPSSQIGKRASLPKNRGGAVSDRIGYAVRSCLVRQREDLGSTRRKESTTGRGISVIRVAPRSLGETPRPGRRLPASGQRGVGHST